jgi:hypothetical protein
MMLMILRKATIHAAGQSSLFPEHVQVKGHVREGRFVGPHTATRRKRIEEAPNQHMPQDVPDKPTDKKMSPEAEAKWEAMLARGAADKKRAQEYADAGKPMKFKDNHRDDMTWLVTPEVHEGHKPGAWRATYFDASGPAGHMEFNNAFDAFMEMRAKEPIAPKPLVVVKPTAEPEAKPAPKEPELPKGAEWIEGRGPLGSGKWGVRLSKDTPGLTHGRLGFGNLFPTKAEAAADAHVRTKEHGEWVEREKAKEARDQAIAAKLKAGEEITDDDLKHLGLRTQGGSWFDYISPVVQRLFPHISKAKVREAMGDALRDSHSDMGVKKTIANPRKALANAAAWKPAPKVVVTRGKKDDGSRKSKSGRTVVG